MNSANFSSISANKFLIDQKYLLNSEVVDYFVVQTIEFFNPLDQITLPPLSYSLYGNKRLQLNS